MRPEDLGLVGNCQFSALVDRSGAVVWCCMPRFDSEPIFASLLDKGAGGEFRVAPANGVLGTQRYLENSNILETRFETPDGAFRILDFAPRFLRHGRMFHPTQLCRILEPLDGAPRVRVCCAPQLGWSQQAPAQIWGSHHIRYEGFGSQVRLTTDVPLSYLDGHAFLLNERRHLVLTWGPPVEEPLPPLCDHSLTETRSYWQSWVKNCAVPPRYQREVIRSALALKLHCFEETGAIVAAMTTSRPEAPRSSRTWDGRSCWLREAHHVLEAFWLLGRFEEREQFTRFLLDVSEGSTDLTLAPLYRIDGRAGLEEKFESEGPGSEEPRPGPLGNGAVAHTPSHIFGGMVLALAPAFFDERFAADRSRPALNLLEELTRKAASVAGQPDAAIGPQRAERPQQTFSRLMCWAAARRMAQVATLHRPAVAAEFTAAARCLHHEIVECAWSDKLRSFVGDYGGTELDAALLQMVSLRFLLAEDPRLHQTVEAIQRELTQDGWLVRRRREQGNPLWPLYTFWQIEALARLGRLTEARELLEQALLVHSPLGLLPRDLGPTDQRAWDGFPNVYSCVGLIRAAFATSPAWHEVL